MRCAVPAIGPAAKAGALRDLAGPSAFEGRATNVPSAIEKPRRVVRPSLKGRIPLDVFWVAPDTRCCVAGSRGWPLLVEHVTIARHEGFVPPPVIGGFLSPTAAKELTECRRVR